MLKSLFYEGHYVENLVPLEIAILPLQAFGLFKQSARRKGEIPRATHWTVDTSPNLGLGSGKVSGKVW